jgi:ABC-type transport system substrate-binding protein
VPRKYVEKVGDDGFKKAPVGAGPYRFVSFTPGVELVLEANEQYWRKVPNVKRLVFKSVPDEATRLAMLRRGEADIAYSIRGALAEDLRRTPGLTLKPNYPPGTFWLVFADQWDPKSPWADRRVRLAASLALDAFVAAGGTFTYGTYPDIEGLIGEQASERDAKKREAILHRIQQLIQDKAMFAPIWELAFLNGHGPRVAESGLTLIASHPYSSPYEDLKLKPK